LNVSVQRLRFSNNPSRTDTYHASQMRSTIEPKHKVHLASRGASTSGIFWHALRHNTLQNGSKHPSFV